MQQRHSLLVLIAITVLAAPALAAAQPEVGVTMWRSDTDMQVDRATDWDGSNDTADERAREWDLKSSGVGIRAGYLFGDIFNVYGVLGVAQATTRAIDISDEDFDMTARGMDDGIFFNLGLGASDRFPGAERLFWGADLSMRRYSTELDEDITTTWDFDQTTMALGGRIGYMVREVGVYGGLRFVSEDTDIDVTDRSRLPGFQRRSIDLERDDNVDLMLGAQFGAAPVTGFVEFDFFGSFGAGTGISMHF